MKKILSIIVIVLVIIAVGLAVFWFFNKQEGGGDPFSGGFSIGDFFPFGRPDSGITPPETPPGPPPPPIAPPTETPPKLWKIYGESQAGAVTFIASATPTVRFVDRATGNIFESVLTLTGFKRITNTTIPKIYEAVWQPRGSSVILRYLNESGESIQSLFAKIINLSETDSEDIGELQGTFLPSGILGAAVDSSSGKIAYLAPRTGGGVNLFTTDANGEKAKLIYGSSIKDWIVSWVKNDTISLTSKASAGIPGYLYFLKADSGSIERVLGNVEGLTTLPNKDGSKIIYSEIKGGKPILSVYDKKVGKSSPLSLSTFPEKCVWSSDDTDILFCASPNAIPSGTYPDNWYQGKISFSDSLWKINTLVSEVVSIVDLTVLADENIDAVNLLLDPTQNHLVFTNKKDGALWGLRLE